MRIKVDGQFVIAPYMPNDKGALIAYLNDEDIARNTLRIPYPYTEKDAEEWLQFADKQFDTLGCYANWAIRDAQDQLIGGIGRLMLYGKDTHMDEIGYWLARPYRGQGLMTRVVRAYCNYLFEQEHLVRITASVFPHNPASVRVLEKADFQREGYLRKHYKKADKYLDGILFAKIAD
jgi:ribosomal-protein-alanine N-acetyltransferase